MGSFELRNILIVKSIKSPFFWICCLYILTAKGHLEIIDTEYSVRTAKAILRDGSLLIEPVDPTIRKVSPDIPGTAKVYSQYGLGLVAVFLPVVLVGEVVALFFPFDSKLIIDFLLSFYNIPFAVLGLWLFRAILLEFEVSKGNSNFLILILGVCTAYWKYSVTDFSEVTQTVFLLGIVYSIISNDQNKWKKASFWCSLLIAVKLVYVVFIPILTVYAYLEKGTNLRRRIRISNVVDLSFFLIPLGFLLAFANFIRFGSIFEAGYGTYGVAFSTNYLRRDLFDYIFSLQRGILPFNPILLLALPCWLAIPKKFKGFFILIFLLCILWIVLMSCWVSFQGGWCWGNRLLVPIIPLLLLPLAFINFRLNIIKILLFLFIPISILMQVSAVFVKTEETIVLRSTTYSTTLIPPPPQLVANLILFAQKISSSDVNHPISILANETDCYANFSEKKSYHGFNLWPIHLLKAIGLSAKIHLFGNIFLILTTCFLFVFFCFFKPQ